MGDGAPVEDAARSIPKLSVRPRLQQWSTIVSSDWIQSILFQRTVQDHPLLYPSFVSTYLQFVCSPADSSWHRAETAGFKIRVPVHRTERCRFGAFRKSASLNFRCGTNNPSSYDRIVRPATRPRRRQTPDADLDIHRHDPNPLLTETAPSLRQTCCPAGRADGRA